MTASPARTVQFTDEKNESNSSLQRTSFEGWRTEEEQFIMHMRQSLQQNFKVLTDTDSPDASDPEAILQHNLEVLSKLLFPIEYLFTKQTDAYRQGLTTERYDGWQRICEAFRTVLGEALELTTTVQANAQQKLLAAQMIVTLSSELQTVDVTDEATLPQKLKELQATAEQKLRNSLSHKVNPEDINRLMAMIQDLVYNLNIERNNLASDVNKPEGDGGEVPYIVRICYDIFLAFCAFCCCAHDALEKASNKNNSKTMTFDEAIANCHRLADKYARLIKDLDESKTSMTILKHHVNLMCNGADILQEYASIWQMLKEQHVSKAAADYVKKNEKLIESAKDLENICVNALSHWLDRSGVRPAESAAAKQSSST